MQLQNGGSRDRAALLAPWLAIVLWSCAGEIPPEWGLDAGPTGSDATPPPSTCDGIDCGAFGTCVQVGSVAVCDCMPGYHNEGMTCVPDSPSDPCYGITCGANAHCDQGKCFCDDGYDGNPDQGCTSILTEEERARAELVEIAWAELGVCEGQDIRPYIMEAPGSWCYAFVEWVYAQSSYDLPELWELTEYWVWALPEGWRPEPGDLIKFTYQHYAMVAEVSADGQTITTIEGNYSSCVQSRDITDYTVSYYGTLDPVFN